MDTMRFVNWGHWSITFWEGDRNNSFAINKRDRPRAICEINFPVGLCGPVDGIIGSVERQKWIDICHNWVNSGNLPEGAFCDVNQVWLYDNCPDARWVEGRWESPIRLNGHWVWRNQL